VNILISVLYVQINNCNTMTLSLHIRNEWTVAFTITYHPLVAEI